MKKYMYFAAMAAAAMFSSCSSDENVAVTPQGETDLVPVVLSANSASASVSTKGTGSVGDLDGEANIFQYEDIFVLMTKTEEENWGFSTLDFESGSTAQFDGSFFCRPMTENGVTTLEYSLNSAEMIAKAGVYDASVKAGTDGALRYYPVVGSSDFFAFHVDDAAQPVFNTDDVNKTMTVDFEIDGSQDIMAGKAASFPKTNVRGYSAKTAREGVTPVINMKHMLTRLTFEVVSGHSSAKGVKINSLSVESANKGTLTCAYLSADEKNAQDLVAWDTQADKTWFKLMKKPVPYSPTMKDGKPSLVPLTDVTLDATGSKSLGEAMFVCPGEDIYNMKLVATQKVQVSNTGDESVDIVEEPVEYPLTIEEPNDGTFKPGYSYHVKIIVYGMEGVIVQATLEPWADGGIVDIDTAEQ